MSYSRIPCGLPNSLTPVTGPVFLGGAAMAERMNAGSDAMRGLVESLGGVWPGAFGSGGGSAYNRSAFADGGSDSGWFSGGGFLGGGYRASGAGSGLRRRGARVGAGTGSVWRNGVSLPLPNPCGGVVVSTVPGSWRPLTPVLRRPADRVVTPVQARIIEQLPRPQQDPAICRNITPDTVCEAAHRGCFAAGQVDPIQLAACVASGWQGNRNEFPAVVARGGANNGARVGLVNARPKQPNGQPGNGVLSLSDGVPGEIERVASGLSGGVFDAAGNSAIALGVLLVVGALLVRKGGAR